MSTPRRGVFVTGTDTGVGKSVVSAALLCALRDANLRAVGMKPVASGCDATRDGLRNADAELLLAHGSGAPAYVDVNPYAFAPAIAPHIAAREANVTIALPPIAAAFARLHAQADFVLMEGVGGWLAPLSEALMQSDLARHFALPVVLVVGLRLGCLNHAALSARAIVDDGGVLAGWIGNTLDPAMPRLKENIDTLRTRLHAPCLGIAPYAPDADPRALAPSLRPAVAALR